VSYEPLHHKYRPQIFADLVGQEAIATTLTQAIATQRIAPAYLFTGPRGTGKTSSARILAKSLNCLQNPVPTARPCGKCNVCLSITANYAVDVVEIDAASNTGVDNIRDVIERAQFAPVQCRYKVYVIDECHMLSTAAFNSLLKTLEEPPPRVVFVLATTDPQRVLPTIISRCQRFDFRRIPLGAMVQHLKYIAETESIKITPEAIALVAQVSQGGLRDAESLLDQLSLLTVEITNENVWDLVGAVSEQDLLALTKAIASDHPESVLAHCRRLLDRGREPLIVLQNLAGFYRDLLIAKTAPNRNDLVAITPTTWTQLCEFAQKFTPAQILQGSQHLKTSEAQIKNTTQPRLWLEVTLIGLLPSASIPVPVPTSVMPQTARQYSAPSQSTPTPVQPSATTGKVRVHEEPATPVQPAASISPPPAKENPTQTPPAQPTAGSNTELEQIWQQLLDQLQFSSKALFSQHGYLISFDGQQAQIGIRAPKLIKAAQPKLPELEMAFQKALNQKIRVTLVVNQSGITPTQPTSEATTNQERVPLPAPTAPTPEIKAKTPLPSQLPSVTPSVTGNADAINLNAQPPQAARESTGFNNQPPQAARESTDDVPPTPPLVSDWNGEEIEKALGNLKHFFDGEIVDLNDELVVNTEPAHSDSFSATVAKLEASLSQPIPETLPRRQEELNFSEPVPPQREALRQTEWDDDDEDDIPF
jgi:DNA polymerase III subunit gamma/tau